MIYLDRRKFLKSNAAVGLGMLVFGRAGLRTARAETTLNDIDFLGEPGRWNTYSREREQGCDVVQAIEFTLNQETFPAGSDLVVAADVITVSGITRTNGRNITLAARKVVFLDGAEIITSGASADARLDRAPDGASAGAAGSDGLPGAAGNPGGDAFVSAGSIEGKLLITANGGSGAKGQAGGNGMQGTTGERGSQASRRAPPGNGGSGGAGGAAGNGGSGGAGGAAGQIRYFILSGPPIAPVVLAQGGAGGPEGDAGSFGSEGIGGNPGDPCFMDRETDEGRHPRWVKSCDTGRGIVGPNGAVGAAASQPNENGPDGANSTPETSLGESEKLYEYLSASVMLMALYRCELDVLNGSSLEEVVARADWVSRSTKAPSFGKSFYDGKRARQGTQEVGEPSPDELLSINAQINSIVSNLRLGLDAYGHTPHYVSELTPEFLKSQSAEWTGIATTVQGAYLSLLDKNSSLSEKTAQLRRAKQQVDKAYQVGRTRIITAQNGINVLQADILGLSSRLLVLQRDLEQADSDFKNAMASRGSCNIGNMMSFVIGVVAIAAAVYTGGASIGTAMAAINAANAAGKDENSASGIAGVIDDFKFLGKTFQEADLKSRWEEMQKGYQEVQEALKTDRTKIVVSLESFEEQLAPYLEMQEAVRYRDLMRQFADLARTKNDKQYELTQVVHQIAQETAEQSSRMFEAERVGRLVANGNNPALTECVIFLGGFLERAKRQILRVTDLQRRGITYLTCTPITLSYSTARVEELLAPQLQMGDVWLNALQEQGGARQSMDAKFQLFRESDPGLFNGLSQTGQAVFSIPIDEPEFNRGGTSFVTASEVSLEMDNVPESVTALTFRLTHSGTSAIKNKSGGLFTFVHSRRPTILSYKKAGKVWIPTAAINGNLRGDDRFISLSPFTTWTLNLENFTDIDLSPVRTITLNFGLTMIPADKLYSPEKALFSMPN